MTNDATRLLRYARNDDGNEIATANGLGTPRGTSLRAMTSRGVYIALFNAIYLLNESIAELLSAF